MSIISLTSLQNTFTYTCRLTNTFKNLESSCRKTKEHGVHTAHFSVTHLSRDSHRLALGAGHDSLVGAAHIGTYKHILRCRIVFHHPRDLFQTFPVRTMHRDEPVTCFSTSRPHQEVDHTKPHGPTPSQGQAPVHKFKGERSAISSKEKGDKGKHNSCRLLAFFLHHNRSTTYPRCLNCVTRSCII
jgi:hypothetical protein